MYFKWPVPKAVRCKASIYGRSPAENVGSDRSGDGYFSVVSVKLCQSIGLCDELHYSYLFVLNITILRS